MVVKNENYILIQGWMINELNLKGTELLVYAIIYGFSQDGQNKFDGSLKYLSEWTNTSKQSVLTALQNLVAKNLLIKENMIKNGVKFCIYYANIFNGVFKKFEWGYSKNLNEGIKKTLTNNIVDIIERKTNYNNIPTKKDVEDYLKILGKKIDIENFMNYYNASDWLDKSGLPINWKQKALSWSMNNQKVLTDKEKGQKFYDEFWAEQLGKDNSNE